ncbi:MAG: FkbM family methyltransferase [Thalassobaculaceae bacterium]
MSEVSAVSDAPQPAARRRDGRRLPEQMDVKTATALLADPADPRLLKDFVVALVWHADVAATRDWSRRLGAISEPGDRTAEHVVALTRRLEAGENQRESFRRPVTQSFKFNTPMGDVLFARDDALSQQFFRTLLPDGKLHEPGLVAYLCRNLTDRDVFVDIGAHTGYLACFAGVTGASVITMEFQRPLNRVIERNFALNGLRRTNVLEVAASDRDGTTIVPAYNAGFGAKLYSEQTILRTSTFPAYGAMTQIVPTMRLDTLFADLDAPPTCIKIDAEGFELRILRGAERLIAACRTTFIVEFHAAHVSQFGNDASELDEVFPEADWRVLHLQDRATTELDRDGLHRLIASQDGTDNPHLIFRPR